MDEFRRLLQALQAYLEGIEQISNAQKAIALQQKNIQENQDAIQATLDAVKKEGALILKQIEDLQKPSKVISKDLEKAIKAVAVRARSIDEKVPDSP